MYLLCKYTCYANKCKVYKCYADNMDIPQTHKFPYWRDPSDKQQIESFSILLLTSLLLLLKEMNYQLLWLPVVYEWNAVVESAI